jgi:L-lactate dehydrogenase complex protein LldG
MLEGEDVVTGRAAILSRLAAAQRTAFLPAAPSAAAIETPSHGVEDCLERFTRELAALGVECHVEGTPEHVRDRVRSLVGGRRVLAWDAGRLPYAIDSVLAAAARGGSPRDEQAGADVGVTGCDGAIAETGSLVLFSGRGRSRAVSLLPPVHLAVVKRQDLYFSMGEFFARAAAPLAGEACCTFVTGPSRTADIELTLTLGVHGPGQVIVVVGP